jgi:predicted PurR-regulated permease PerM
LCTANNIVGYLGDAAVTMFYVLFLLAPPRVPTRLRSQIVRRIHGAVKKFVLIMVALSAVRAAMVGGLIYACGVPGSLAGSVAIVSFWLFFIPNLGSFIATVIPLPLIVLLPDLTDAQRWCALFIPALGSFVVGDVLGPTVYRRGLGLNEVVILLSLVFWFSVWGGIGAVLAVPIMCAVRISLEEIPHRGTHALARMMAPVATTRRFDGFGDRAAPGDVSDTASDVTGGDGLDTDGLEETER